jgi:hypothetical protein
MVCGSQAMILSCGSDPKYCMYTYKTWIKATATIRPFRRQKPRYSNRILARQGFLRLLLPYLTRDEKRVDVRILRVSPGGDEPPEAEKIFGGEEFGLRAPWGRRNPGVLVHKVGMAAAGP